MTDNADPLDPRLHQVLLAKARGRTNQQIADAHDLALALGTVRARAKVLRWTLGVPAHTHTVTHAYALGYLHPGDATTGRRTDPTPTRSTT